MKIAYFRHLKTQKRYRIVSIDHKANTVTLATDAGQFVEPYDKERFVKLGYVLETEDTDAIEPEL